jgi:CTP:molybdopterin cytidylyltransferase MocA
MVSAVVPAAGSASRFGGGKLAALVDGVPMLDRTVGALLAGSIDEVIVVIAPTSSWTSRVSSLAGARVRTAINPDPDRGMFSSIQIGVRAAAESPIVLLPADMPFVQPATVAAVREAGLRTGDIVSPRFETRRGHPIFLPCDLRALILAAPDDSTLSDVLRGHAARRVHIDVTDRGVLRDVDVVEDLVS